MTTARLIVTLVAAAIIALALLQLAGPYLYQYRLGDQRFEVKLFGLLPILRIRFSEISEARVMAGPELLNPWAGVRFGNRIFAARPVMIRKKRGLIRSLILTPLNPEEFVAELNRRRSNLL